jgi:cbb3-type cytochrome oxidase subunit 3
MQVAYLVLGLVLCLALVGVAAFYYSRQRRDQVEAAKYRMLDDEDEKANQ